jgi:hypothetical protein
LPHDVVRGFDVFSTVGGRVGNNVQAVKGGFEAVMTRPRSVKRDSGFPVEHNVENPGVRCASEVVIEEVFAFVCSRCEGPCIEIL